MFFIIHYRLYIHTQAHINTYTLNCNSYLFINSFPFVKRNLFAANVVQKHNEILHLSLTNVWCNNFAKKHFVCQMHQNHIITIFKNRFNSIQKFLFPVSFRIFFYFSFMHLIFFKLCLGQQKCVFFEWPRNKHLFQ